MSIFGDDLTTTNLPEPVDMPDGRHRPPAAPNGGLEVRSLNANLGAIRVAVPRSLQKVNRAVQELASMAGSEWTYSLPFKRRDRATGRETVRHVEGPTIKCALDIARCYGNCVVDVPRVEDLGDAWVFHGRFLDIETGFQVERPFRQRKTQNIGDMGGDRGRIEDIVFQIGASKAMRNVVVNALPTIIDRGQELAKHSIRSWIEQNRPKALQRIRTLLEETGIAVTRVEAFFAQKLDDLTVPEIAQVAAQLKAVEEGYTRAEEVFPAPEVVAGEREETAAAAAPAARPAPAPAPVMGRGPQTEAPAPKRRGRPPKVRPAEPERMPEDSMPEPTDPEPANEEAAGPEFGAMEQAMAGGGDEEEAWSPGDIAPPDEPQDEAATLWDENEVSQQDLDEGRRLMLRLERAQTKVGLDGLWRARGPWFHRLRAAQHVLADELETLYQDRAHAIGFAADPERDGGGLPV